MATAAVIQETQSVELADRLRERIQSSGLADGDLFMTEAELAEEYGVSRTVARGAVGRLAAIGLLEGRKRKGLVVRRPDPLRLLELGLPSLFDSQQDISELAMLRYVLEMGAVEPAVRHGTEDQVRRLSELADEMEEAIHNGTSEQVADIDIAFHSVLLEMTGSTLVAGMQRVLVRFFASNREAVPNEATDNRVIWEHQELATAIRDRDANQARAMLHLQAREWLSFPKSDEAGS
ncbi:MAG: FadR/GntR family transcriptional regulator [Planctomycetales bacterium]|jgi:GntR family transcriptional repressor for pyruvate dehydrogenase complex